MRPRRSIATLCRRAGVGKESQSLGGAFTVAAKGKYGSRFRGADYVVTYAGEDCRLVRQECRPGRALQPGAEALVGKTAVEILGEAAGRELCEAVAEAVHTGTVRMVTTTYGEWTYQSMITPDRQSFVRILGPAVPQPADRRAAGRQ